MKVGKNCKISPLARLYGDDIEIGDNVRIDDFCIITGNTKIGSHVHICAYSFFSGGSGIVLEDFSEFAARTTVLSASDDYHGLSLVGPCIPDKFKPTLHKGKVVIKRHVLLGVGCTVMPGVTIGEGASVGAYSFVHKDLEPWKIYAGIPAKLRGWRSRDMLVLEKEFLREYAAQE